jgi:GNAT superfamily N-acetyltransferase
MNKKNVFRIVEAEREHAADLLKVRLEAVQNCPVAFTTDIERDAKVDWVERIENPDGQIFLAYAGDKSIGMAGIYRGNSSKTKHTAGIWGVYVSADHRRAGIAKAFFDAAIAWAKANEIIIVKLGVAVENIPAYTFYKNYGFVDYGREPKAIRVGKVLHDEYLMAMEIN